METTFYKFPSIESFSSVVKNAEKYGCDINNFVIKTKIHGTNAAIVITPNQIYAQSRNRVIVPDDDNLAFAKFVHEELKTKDAPSETIVFYGEWCGKGIQNHDAITQLDKKMFGVFAIYLPAADEMISATETIKQYVDDYIDDENVFVIDDDLDIYIDFSNKDELEDVTKIINVIVKKYETEDSFVKERFGISAPGEGVVVSPNGWFTRQDYSNFTFKAKVSSHQVNRTKKPATIDPEVLANITAFVDMFATEARFNQAITECNLERGNMKQIGAFLKFVNQDIIKESVNELEQSELEWKQCQGAVTVAARNWFMGR